MEVSILGGFEWDPDKSKSNQAKHGVNFDAAIVIWHDSRRVSFDSTIVSGEPRQLTIGKIGEKIYTAMTTPRGDNTRIISVRRARDQEVRFYDRRNNS